MANGTVVFEIDPALTGVSQTNNTAVANFTELGSEGLTVGSVSDFNGSYDSTSFPKATWMSDGGASINHKPYLKFRLTATYQQLLCFGGAGGVGPQTIATALQGDNTITFLIRTADVSQYYAIFAPHNAATGAVYMGNASIQNGYHKTYTGLDETCGVCQIGQGGVGPTPQTGHWLINTWAFVTFVTTWKTHSAEVGVFLNGFKQYTAIIAHAPYTNSSCDYICLNGGGYLVGNVWGNTDLGRIIVRNAALTDGEVATQFAALIANYVFTPVDPASSIYPVIMADSITANYPWPHYQQSKLKQLLGRDVIVPGIGVGGARLEAAGYGSNNYNVWGAATTLSDISDRFQVLNPAIKQYQTALGVNDTYNGLGSGGVISRVNYATYLKDWTTNHILNTPGNQVMHHYNNVAWEFTQGVGNGVDVAGNWSSTNITAINRGISDAVTTLASIRVTLGDTTVEADSLASFAGAHPWTAQDDVHPVDPYGTVGLALPRAAALANIILNPPVAPTTSTSLRLSSGLSLSGGLRL